MWAPEVPTHAPLPPGIVPAMRSPCSGSSRVCLDLALSQPSLSTSRNQAFSHWRLYEQISSLDLLHNTGQSQIVVPPGWANLVLVLLSRALKLVAAPLHETPAQSEQGEVSCKALKNDVAESLVPRRDLHAVASDPRKIFSVDVLGV